MNRLFRIHGYSIVLLLALLTTTSCSKEDLSNNTYYESAWCVVQGKGSQLVFVADNKDLLKPSESLDSNLYKAGERYRVFYISLGNQSTYSAVSGAKLVEITNLQPVFVENVMMHAAYNGSVNDPVWLNVDPFFGGGFLNLDFHFDSSDPLTKHGIHLLQDSLVNRKLYLRFGHDAKGDAKVNTASALASFPTNSFQRAPEADSLIVFVHGNVGFRSYRLALKDTLL